MGIAAATPNAMGPQTGLSASGSLARMEPAANIPSKIAVRGIGAREQHDRSPDAEQSAGRAERCGQQNENAAGQFHNEATRATATAAATGSAAAAPIKRWRSSDSGHGTIVGK
jgi:hypothetical protein